MTRKNILITLLSVGAICWASFRLSNQPLSITDDPTKKAEEGHKRAGDKLARRVTAETDRSGSLLLLSPPTAPASLGPNDPRTWMTRQVEVFLERLPDSITVQTTTVLSPNPATN